MHARKHTGTVSEFLCSLTFRLRVQAVVLGAAAVAGGIVARAFTTAVTTSKEEDRWNVSMGGAGRHCVTKRATIRHQRVCLPLKSLQIGEEKNTDRAARNLSRFMEQSNQQNVSIEVSGHCGPVREVCERTTTPDTVSSKSTVHVALPA